MLTASSPAYFDLPQATVAKPLQNLMEQLSGRWMDEAQYEDINDYADAIRKALPEGVELVKMHKRPFGFTFNQAGHTFKLTCGSRVYTLSHLGTVGTVTPAAKPVVEPAPEPDAAEPTPDAEPTDEQPIGPESDDCYVVIIHNADDSVVELTAVPARAARFARRMARNEWIAAGNSADGIEFNARYAGPDHA